MRKTFELEELDCAACAAKMEDGIRKIEGVSYVQVNFLSQKLTLESPDEIFEKENKKAAAVCRKTEPDCRIIR